MPRTPAKAGVCSNVILQWFKTILQLHYVFQNWCELKEFLVCSIIIRMNKNCVMSNRLKSRVIRPLFHQAKMPMRGTEINVLEKTSTNHS